AAASGDTEEARARICEAAFLASIMGVVGALLLGLCTPWVLNLVLAPDAPARAFAVPYLKIRALSFVPALFSTVGFAAFRGVMDTVTPLRVSLVSNLINLGMDPVLMFSFGMGISGAAAATVLAEVTAGAAYVVLLFRRKLMTASSLLRVPKFSRLVPLLQGGAAVQLRSVALNAAFIFATRRAQEMDTSGVSAAAYSISILFWQLGGVALFALQSSASILIPSERVRKGGGPEAERAVADRLLVLGLGMGILVGCLQFAALPVLSAFSTLPEVARHRQGFRNMMRISGKLLSLLGVLVGASAKGVSYVHQENYLENGVEFNPAGAPSVYNFFSKWEFFHGGDPTKGFVDYVTAEAAMSDRLINITEKGVWMGVDTVNQVPWGSRGRKSVRLESNRRYNSGLFVISMDHMPTGCGTWPAFWMFGQDPQHPWPTWGEYDIVEWIHEEKSVSTTLHTNAACGQEHLVPGVQMQASWNRGSQNNPADNCDVNAGDQYKNQGCSQKGPENSVGSSFNANGGGTFAADWDPVAEHIRTWFWPAGQEPADVKQKNPQPDSWGKPFSYFSLSPEKCHPGHFKDMRIIFDTTFCGDFAGDPGLFKQHCPAQAQKYRNCDNFVRSEPQAFKEAYWSVTALDVYQRSEAQITIPAALFSASSFGLVSSSVSRDDHSNHNKNLLEQRVKELEAILEQKDQELEELWETLRAAGVKRSEAGVQSQSTSDSMGGGKLKKRSRLPPGLGQGMLAAGEAAAPPQPGAGQPGEGQPAARRRRRTPNQDVRSSIV
ncbi:unnamed protein product, partial [Polarella glacialis]